MQVTDRKAEQRPLLAIEDVAELLAVGVRHIRRLVAQRRIPYLKWGHLLRFDPVEIQAWLDGSRRPVELERPVVPGLPQTAMRRAAGGRWPAPGSR